MSVKRLVSEAIICRKLLKTEDLVSGDQQTKKLKVSFHCRDSTVKVKMFLLLSKKSNNLEAFVLQKTPTNETPNDTLLYKLRLFAPIQFFSLLHSQSVPLIMIFDGVH